MRGGSITFHQTSWEARMMAKHHLTKKPRPGAPGENIPKNEYEIASGVGLARARFPVVATAHTRASTVKV